MMQPNKEDINSQFYRYLGAYILVALSGCLGNVVDGIIVGNLISGDGVSAINLSKPINQFIFTLHLLINAGAGMLVGYSLGKNREDEARRLFTRALALSVGLGLILALFGGLLFPTATARLLCSNQEILPLARDYMQVLLIGNPAFILMWGLSTADTRKLMESSSNTTYLEVISAQSNLLNAEINEVSDQFSKMQSVVNLYQALGGGAK